MSRNRLACALAVVICAVLLGGCPRLPAKGPAPSPRVAPPSPHKTGESSGVTASLYFGDADGAKLRKVQTQLPSADTAPLDVVKRLLDGPPKGSGLVALIPAGTQVNGVDVEDGVATVDLNAAFRDNFPQGSNTGYLCIYSIVHTLCDLPGIRSVRIAVGGRPVDALGQVDLRDPLTPDPQLVTEGD